MTRDEKDEWAIAILALMRYDRYREPPVAQGPRGGGLLKEDKAATQTSIANRVEQVNVFMDTVRGHVDREALRRTGLAATQEKLANPRRLQCQIFGSYCHGSTECA